VFEVAPNDVTGSREKRRARLKMLLRVQFTIYAWIQLLLGNCSRGWGRGRSAKGWPQPDCPDVCFLLSRDLSPLSFFRLARSLLIQRLGHKHYLLKKVRKVYRKWDERSKGTLQRDTWPKQGNFQRTRVSHMLQKTLALKFPQQKVKTKKGPRCSARQSRSKRTKARRVFHGECRTQ
jgi:hypothetical protein